MSRFVEMTPEQALELLLRIFSGQQAPAELQSDALWASWSASQILEAIRSVTEARLWAEIERRNPGIVKQGLVDHIHFQDGLTRLDLG